MAACEVALGTSEAENLVSGKAECFLAIGEGKKSKLSGMKFSFNTIHKLIDWNYLFFKILKR